MAESLEYRALLECLNSLAIALTPSPAPIADELAASGLLPPSDITDQRTSHGEQARQLARSILDKVKLAPARYHDILNILSKHQWLEDFVHILQTTHSKY